MMPGMTTDYTPRQFQAHREDLNRRIERFLAKRLDSSKEHVEKLLRQGRVRSGQRVLRRGDRLAYRETIEIHRGPTTRPDPQANHKVRFTVIHEDPDVIGVFKPAGVAMHPGPGHGNDTLLNGLISRFPELLTLGAEREFGLAHRLDLETSGLLLVGRSAAGYEGLVEAFKSRSVHKEYLALVLGRPSGLIEGEIDGKEAATVFELVETAEEVSLVRVRPITGRTHQVRIHLAELDCPVLADRRHGRGLDDVTARLFLTRLALHAQSIELSHPVTGSPLRLESDWPKELRKAWKRARKLAATPLTPPPDPPS